jgi:hypothetical protein
LFRFAQQDKSLGFCLKAFDNGLCPQLLFELKIKHISSFQNAKLFRFAQQDKSLGFYRKAFDAGLYFSIVV